MRKSSRVSPTFVEAQKQKRKVLEETPSGNQNNVPALRDRLTVVEEIVAIRSYAVT